MINFLQNADFLISLTWGEAIDQSYELTRGGITFSKKIVNHIESWVLSPCLFTGAIIETGLRLGSGATGLVTILPVTTVYDFFMGKNYSKKPKNIILKNLLAGSTASFCATVYYGLNLLSLSWAGSFIVRQIFSDPAAVLGPIAPPVAVDIEAAG